MAKRRRRMRGLQPVEDCVLENRTGSRILRIQWPVEDCVLENRTGSRILRIQWSVEAMDDWHLSDELVESLSRALAEEIDSSCQEELLRRARSRTSGSKNLRKTRKSPSLEDEFFSRKISTKGKR